MPSNNRFYKYNLILLLFFGIFLSCSAIAKVDEDGIVINEVLYNAGRTGMGCFVELFGKAGTDLDGYRLVGINGNGGKQYNIIDLSGHKIPSSGFFVVGENLSVPNINLMDPKADYQNGPDSIELWFEQERVDAVGYGDFSNAIFAGEKRPTLNISGHSIGRRIDGYDTDDNSIDFVGLAIPSPGEPNLPPQIAVRSRGLLVINWGKIKENMGK